MVSFDISKPSGNVWLIPSIIVLVRNQTITCISKYLSAITEFLWAFGLTAALPATFQEKKSM